MLWISVLDLTAALDFQLILAIDTFTSVICVPRTVLQKLDLHQHLVKAYRFVQCRCLVQELALSDHLFSHPNTEHFGHQFPSL